MQLNRCMTCKANRTEEQKLIQSKGQAKIKNQSKQGVGRPWAWRPTLDAREAGVQHQPEDSKLDKQTEGK